MGSCTPMPPTICVRFPKLGKQTKSPWVEECIDKMSYTYTRILFTLRKERKSDPCYNMSTMLQASYKREMLESTSTRGHNKLRLTGRR